MPYLQGVNGCNKFCNKLGRLMGFLYAMEHNLELILVRECRQVNALYALKLYPYVVGIPDRLILLPGGNVKFVELKDGKRGRLSPAQLYVHKRLREYGFEVWVIRTREDIDEFIRSLGLSEDSKRVDP